MRSTSAKEQHRADWDTLGEVDPLWAILSSPAKRGGRWNLEEFLATGEADAHALIAVADRLGYPARRGAALDFGAGVGRVSRALSPKFESVIGADVSSSMVEQARMNCAGQTNITFVVVHDSPPSSIGPTGFDLVYSRWVLQHLQTERMAIETLRALGRMVRPGGLLAVQVPGRIPSRHRLQPRRRAYSLLQRLGVRTGVLLGQLGLSPIRMIGIAQADVREILAGEGLVVREVQAEVIYGSSIDSFTYYATAAPDPAIESARVD